MSIDKQIEGLIAALNANTEALKAAAGAKPAASTEKPAKPAAEKPAKAAAAKPTHTQAEMNGALIKLKDDFGMDKAKEVLKAHGYEKMADVKEADFDKVFDAAEAKHIELSEGDGGI